MLDARESLPVGVDRTGFRLNTDQLTVPDERHASAANQTAPKLDKPGSNRRPQGCQGSFDPGAFVWHTLHSHTVSSQAQDHRRNNLSNIFRNTCIDPGE